MALKLTDRVVETTQTTGTGVIDLLGAQTGFRTFGADLTSGDTTPYVIVDDPNAPTAYEYGIGTWTDGSPNTLARTTIHGSSNGGNAISLQSGQTYVVTGSLTWQFFLDYFGSAALANIQTSPTDTTPGRLPALFDIGGGVGAIGGDVIQGGVLREIVFIPYDVDPGDLPTGFTKDSAGQVTWDTTAFSWLKFVISEIQGPGGGGGSAQGGSDRAEGSGGGSGAWSRKKIDKADLASSETITMGPPGSGGAATGSPNNGSDGGTSSFGAHHSATGGSGGSGGANTAGGAIGPGGSGGTAIGGDININGRSGGARRMISGSDVNANFGGVAPGGGGNYGDGGGGANTGSSNLAGSNGQKSYQKLYLFG